MQDYVKYSENEIDYQSSDLDAFEKHVKECHENIRLLRKDILLSNWLNIYAIDNTEYLSLVKKEMVKVKEHKKRINDIYSSIPGSLSPDYCNWRYQLLLENSSDCIKAIFECGLFCSSHYKSLGNGYFSEINTPNTKYLEEHVINLFNDYRFTFDQAEKVAGLLRDMAQPVYK